MRLLVVKSVSKGNNKSIPSDLMLFKKSFDIPSIVKKALSIINDPSNKGDRLSFPLDPAIFSSEMSKQEQNIVNNVVKGWVKQVQEDAKAKEKEIRSLTEKAIENSFQDKMQKEITKKVEPTKENTTPSPSDSLDTTPDPQDDKHLYGS